VITLSQNVFGNLDWINLSKVSESIEKDAYELLRTSQWKPKGKKRKPKEPVKPGKGDVPEHIVNVEILMHKERKVLSLIDMTAWDKAQWGGCGFLTDPRGLSPPCIGLIFKEEEGARDIFTGWLSRLGKEDEKEELRISVITGVDKNNPAHYRVHVGTNINAYEKSGDWGHFIMVAKYKTLMPDNDKNLARFLEAYDKHGIYRLLPAIGEEGSKEPKVIQDLFLYKKSLIVKPAWQIGENDEDFIALQVGDKPIIPKDVKDAPVLKALERKQRMKKNRK
jgi:hypothetical protein